MIQKYILKCEYRSDNSDIYTCMYIICNVQYIDSTVSSSSMWW